MFDPRGPWSEHSHRALHSGDPCSIRARPAGIFWFTKEELFWLKFKYLKKMFRKKKLLQFIKPNRSKTVRVRVAWRFLAVYMYGCSWGLVSVRGKNGGHGEC